MPWVTSGWNRFNVAALRGARKSREDLKELGERLSLQCGRAPRSAEIATSRPKRISATPPLQCGRAPRSAEITEERVEEILDAAASMWPRSEERGNLLRTFGPRRSK